MEIATIVGPLIFATIAALLCRGMASNAGRRVWLWTVLGFVLPLISIIVLMVLGKTGEQMLAEAERRR